MNLRNIGMGILGVCLGLVVATAASAQAVMQSVTVRVERGHMDDYRASVAKLQGVLDRTGDGGKVAIWNATFAGAGAGTTLVGVSFPSLAAFAESTAKTNADAEWQKTMAGLDDIRTVVSTGLLVSADDGRPVSPPAAGSVLQGVIVRAKPGKTDAYLAKLAALRKVQKRIESSGEMRVWQVSLGGEAAGSIAVGIVYPSLAAYAADSVKLQADSEGSKIFARLDDIRTVVSSSLFTAQ